MWKQKADRGDSRATKSTEESTAKSISTGKGSSDVLKERRSVFKRLGSSEDGNESGGSKGRSQNRSQEHDLRVMLSGGSQGEKVDGKSSKGSRSPPTVFERLSSPIFSTLRENKRQESSAATKRRRQSGSNEDRQSKKAKRDSLEKEKASFSSVFLRLGGTEVGT
ncbi:unnamed protein product [Brassica oleracea]